MKKKLKELVLNNIEEALEKLSSSFSINNRIENQILISKNRYYQLKQRNNLGVLNNDDFRIELNKIVLSTLELIDDIFENVSNDFINIYNYFSSIDIIDYNKALSKMQVSKSYKKNNLNFWEIDLYKECANKEINLILIKDAFVFLKSNSLVEMPVGGGAHFSNKDKDEVLWIPDTPNIISNYKIEKIYTISAYDNHSKNNGPGRGIGYGDQFPFAKSIHELSNVQLADNIIQLHTTGHF